ncbi:hypothetical protein FOMG_18052 [Fusarium oxysporum f. sp. melonis 26406]|uniref:Uncharacterized protein n=1 Tax=Fusarium oxysporum f. sp. melonis 26406 TaxID=1089452 RepID=W9ZAJ5_FUSOX|nr:hypothetical protein FOMG_18052 [Fusarium oxysporum f. sp. melonis 26406]EXK25283.1 hypothetical protein FOMG_18052 [Fusarium oxysporum f. sp. melonis 26406]
MRRCLLLDSSKRCSRGTTVYVQARSLVECPSFFHTLPPPWSPHTCDLQQAYREICGVQHGEQLSPLKPTALAKMEIEDILQSPRRRFIYRYILNVDETPIPYSTDSQST